MPKRTGEKLESTEGQYSPYGGFMSLEIICQSKVFPNLCGATTHSHQVGGRCLDMDALVPGAGDDGTIWKRMQRADVLSMALQDVQWFCQVGIYGPHAHVAVVRARDHILILRPKEVD